MTRDRFQSRGASKYSVREVIGGIVQKETNIIGGVFLFADVAAAMRRHRFDPSEGEAAQIP